MTDPNLPPLAPSPAAPWPESMDPDRLAASLLSVLLTKGLDGTESAFKGLTQYNDSLLSAPRETILKALTRDAALLDALFVVNVRDASQATRADHKALYTATAIKCQKSRLAVLAAIHKLTEDQHRVDALEAD